MRWSRRLGRRPRSCADCGSSRTDWSDRCGPPWRQTRLSVHGCHTAPQPSIPLRFVAAIVGEILSPRHGVVWFERLANAGAPRYREQMSRRRVDTTPVPGVGVGNRAGDRADASVADSTAGPSSEPRAARWFARSVLGLARRLRLRRLRRSRDSRVRWAGEGDEAEKNQWRKEKAQPVAAFSTAGGRPSPGLARMDSRALAGNLLPPPGHVLWP